MIYITHLLFLKKFHLSIRLIIAACNNIINAIAMSYKPVGVAPVIRKFLVDHRIGHMILLWYFNLLWYIKRR